MRADIFCRVVDNYGDIGVCWRLARRLAHGLGWTVRLWVDDLAPFARIEPGVHAQAARQAVQGVEVVHWTRPAPDLEPGDAVIEAFACDPPPTFVARMAESRPVWVNLEYLSAEDWIESCHGLPSPQAGGLIKHFFFPGFTAATGGLLREPGLIAERDAWRADRARQDAFLAGLGLPAGALQAWRDGARLHTLFCYPHAPAAELADALAGAPIDALAGPELPPALLLAPQGVAPGLAEGRRGRAWIARIPFLTQPGYDRLLWTAEANFVRGEDSFVRALWAGRPLVWQIYPQDEDAHLDKLAAWLDRYEAPPPVRELFMAWNAAPGAAPVARALAGALAGPAWPDWTAHADARAREAASRPDLADALAAFILRQARTG